MVDEFPLELLLRPDETTLERLLTGWLGARTNGSIADVVAPAVPLPDALRSGLSVLSGWPGVYEQNALRAPEAIDEVRGLHRFLDENQAVCFWGYRSTDADRRDPAVWVDVPGSGQWLVDDRTSTFLIKMTVLELIFGSSELVVSEGSPVPAETLTSGLDRLDELGPLRWEGAADLWFYAAPGVLAMASTDSAGTVAFAWRAHREPV